MATTKQILAELLAVQQNSAARIEALAQTITALQEAIAVLENGPDVLADAQAALAQAQANDAALAALTNPQVQPAG